MRPLSYIGGPRYRDSALSTGRKWRKCGFSGRASTKAMATLNFLNQNLNHTLNHTFNLGRAAGSWRGTTIV